METRKKSGEIHDSVVLKLEPSSRRRGIRFFSVFFPALCVVMYLLYQRPLFRVLISGAS